MSTAHENNNDAAVRKSNIIKKLSFVTADENGLADETALKEKLLRYLSRQPQKIVSEVGVRNWFGKTVPARAKAHKFLSDFIDEEVIYEKLSPSQRKVHNQILDFLQGSLANEQTETTNARKLVFSKASQLIIQTPDIAQEEFKNLCESWSGYYVAYRLRLIDNDERPYAKEVVRLFRANTGLVYRHWHLRDGHQLSSFEGVSILTKETIWLWGVDAANARYRVCHFKRNESANPSHQLYRWGLLHSDIPLGSSRDPASTRIILKKVGEPRKVEEFVKKNVGYCDQDLDNEMDATFIMRTISNEVPSQSNMSWESPIDDNEAILRTSHLTLESKIIGTN